MYTYLLFASFLATFADSLFGPLYAVYVQNIGGGILDVGNTIALYSILTGILIIGIGRLSDYWSKELLSVGGFGLSALGTIGYLYIETPLQLYVLQIVFAFSTALLSAPLQALFAKHIEARRAGLMWALEGGGSKILAGVGLLLGTYVTHTYGFTATFLAIFFLQVCATLLELRVFVNSRKKRGY